MERYRILKEVGDGTCGTVYKALNMETYEIVAVKKMKRKFFFWEECMNLREVKSLRKLNHPNIIKLKEIVRENNELFFIFEHMEYNLYQIMGEQKRPLSEEEIRSFMSQNLLVTNNVIKIADFGLAREVSSMPPYTDYVSTRWYRAPEVLFQSSSYTLEIDQLYKICCVLGTPDWTIFPEATNISRLLSVSYSEILPANLSDIIPNASLEATDLIMQLCSWDPLGRPTAEQALKHPFFHVGKWVPHPLPDPFQMKQNDTAKPNLELNLWDFGREPDDCFLGLTLAVKPSVSNLASPEFEELFLAEMVHKVSQGTGEDILFCSGFQDSSGKSVFWSVLSPDRNGIDTSVDASLSLSFRSVLIFNNSFLLTSVNWQFQFHIPQLELESQQLDSPSSAVHCWPCPHSFNRVEYFC
ncbi:hypothetical protein AAG906_020476 [Vitis piasezkii]